MSNDDQEQALRAIRREELKAKIRQVLEDTIEGRINRYVEIDHQGIIGAHYFAEASSESISTYRDGHFISAVMASQAVNEGILKFVAERNGVPRQKSPRSWLVTLLRRIGFSRAGGHTRSMTELIDEIVRAGLLSKSAGEAATRIAGSFRNDVHHMNPRVAHVNFPDLARRNLRDLAELEREIFGTDTSNGKLVPRQPKYWDVRPDGTVPVFLRLE